LTGIHPTFTSETVR